MYVPLNRFCRRLRELVPLDASDEILLPPDNPAAGKFDAAGGGSSTCVSGGACLSRKELKKAAKRAAKVARRETVSRGESKDGDTPMDTDQAAGEFPIEIWVPYL